MIWPSNSGDSRIAARDSLCGLLRASPRFTDYKTAPG
jgi:hypothetical protein